MKPERAQHRQLRFLRGRTQLPKEASLTLNLELRVDVHPLANVAENVTDQPVRPAHRRVDLGSDTDEPSGNSEAEVVVLGEERDDLGPNRDTLEAAVLLLGDEARSDLDLLLKLLRRIKEGTRSESFSEGKEERRSQERDGLEGSRSGSIHQRHHP